MAKWVTFYWDLFRGVSDLEIHKNKEDATAYFKAHYKSYFQLATKTEVRLPMSYGYPLRKYFAMTKYKFEKEFGPISQEVIDG